MCVYMYVCVSAHVSVCVCVCVCVWRRGGGGGVRACVCVRAWACVSMCVCVCLCVCVCVRAYVCRCMYTCMCVRVSVTPHPHHNLIIHELIAPLCAMTEGSRHTYEWVMLQINTNGSCHSPPTPQPHHTRTPRPLSCALHQSMTVFLFFLRSVSTQFHNNKNIFLDFFRVPPIKIWHMYFYIFISTRFLNDHNMGWLRSIGSIKL